MALLIKKAVVLDPSSSWHSKKADLLVRDGIIENIGLDLTADEVPVLDAEGAYVSIGWMDLQAHFCDPGLEHREDLNSGREAAAAGGYTDVMLVPNTLPVVQNKNAIKYLTEGNAQNLVQIHPQAAVTLDAAGEELTEMYDLHFAGARAFSDGLSPLWHPDIVLKALQYLQPLNALLITRPEDKYMALYGQMHEGEVSTLLGMKGIPALAEELQVIRDLQILRYAGGRLHFSGISTAEAVQHIREAKNEGLKVSCDVAIHSLLWTDKELADYDTHFKVQPPLRDQRHQEALFSGLMDGTIDAIVSAHRPQDVESKFLEFDLAQFGIISLQTMWPSLCLLSDSLPMELLIDKVSSAPRRVLQLPQPRLDVGHAANMTILHPEKNWTLDAESNASKSRNSPLWDKAIKGKVMATIRGQHIRLF
jgi:dihydroorotase